MSDAELISEESPDPASPQATSTVSRLPPGCPPSTSKPHTGPIYRLVKHNPAASEDFDTYFVLYPGRAWKPRELCEAHGLSVRVTLEAAVAHAQQLRARVKAANWVVAVATLDASSGPVAQTYSDPEHHTWWPTENFDFLAAFSVQQNVMP